MRPSEIAERKEFIRRRPIQLLQASVIKLLQCTNPEEFEQLKEQFLFSIDSAQAEYMLLCRELENYRADGIQVTDPSEKISELKEGMDEMTELWQKRKDLSADIEEINGYDLKSRKERLKQIEKDIEETKAIIADLEKGFETKA